MTSDIAMRIMVCGLASGVISTTVTQSSVFRPLRQWVKALRPQHEDGSPWFLGELITCPYCFGHWVALLLTVFSHTPRGFVTLWFATTAISVITSGVIAKLYND